MELRSANSDKDRDRIARIRALNDDLRCNNRGGRVILSGGIMALGPEYARRVRKAVAEFDAFAEFGESDGEHDIGYAQLDGSAFYWMIDYYDPKLELRSEDPSDPSKTVRVLTIVHSEVF